MGERLINLMKVGRRLRSMSKIKWKAAVFKELQRRCDAGKICKIAGMIYLSGELEKVETNTLSEVAARLNQRKFANR